MTSKIFLRIYGAIAAYIQDICPQRGFDDFRPISPYVSQIRPLKNTYMYIVRWLLGHLDTYKLETMTSVIRKR